MRRSGPQTVVRFAPSPADGSTPVRSLWLEQALADEPDTASQPVDELPARADVCIVGGGYTGLWTALALKQRDSTLEVVVVEADICGSGASGRNGGFAMTAWSKFSSLSKLCGSDDALRYARATERSVADIGAFCEEHGIDAGFEQRGWLWAATSPAQVDAWKETIERIAAAGAEPFELLEPDEVARRAGSPAHLAGVFEPGVATVHPARLARGLAKIARRCGVRIVERTQMVELIDGARPRVVTTRGVVEADRVVLAINAWAAAVPELRRALVVIASDVIATEPAPAELDRIGWAAGLAISDSRRLVNYYRRLDDGTVVFGKGGGALAPGGRIASWFNGRSARADQVLAQLRRLYPSLWNVALQSSWCGPIDYSASSLPFFGALPGRPAILACAGFSGNGVGPAHLAGQTLATLALGERPADVPEALQRPPSSGLPPEPLRYLGGRIVRAAVARKEALEDAGRRPPSVLTRVSGLDPTGFVDRA